MAACLVLVSGARAGVARWDLSAQEVRDGDTGAEYLAVEIPVPEVADRTEIVLGELTVKVGLPQGMEVEAWLGSTEARAVLPWKDKSRRPESLWVTGEDAATEPLRWDVTEELRRAPGSSIRLLLRLRDPEERMTKALKGATEVRLTCHLAGTRTVRP